MISYSVFTDLLLCVASSIQRGLKQYGLINQGAGFNPLNEKPRFHMRSSETCKWVMGKAGSESRFG
jgi:hypothetical protein